MHPAIRQEIIPTNRFSPVMLSCSMFTQGKNYPKGHRLEPRYIFDYEMEYITYSEGAMLIEETEYPIRKGDIVFRKPGQYAQGILPYTCYLICFDLLGNTGKNPATHDIIREQEFQTSYINPVLDLLPPVFSSPYPEKYQPIFEFLFTEYLMMKEGSELILKTYILQLIYQLYMDVRNPLTNHAIPTTPYYVTIRDTLAYIEKNYSQKITLEILAENISLSPSHFHKIFSRAMNITPNEYLTKIRLEKARELLVKTDLNIYEIALQCGFENIPYFNYLFKKSLNLSPREFRRRLSYI